MANLLTLKLTGAKSDRAETLRTRVADDTGVPGTFGEASPWSTTSSSAHNASEKERMCLESSEVVLESVRANSRVVHIICSKQSFRSETRPSSGTGNGRIRHGST